MPKVSVIIPTYNRANFVTRAIASVLAQTFDDYELIVIDDGSTDNTQEVLEPYRKKIRYIQQENSGVSAARNVGIRLAQGDWVAFLDSDDEWLPEYLSWQMEQIHQNPQVCAHITNSITFLDNGKIENTFQYFKLLSKFKRNSCIILDRPFYYVVKYRPAFYVVTTIMRRKELLKTGLYNTRLTIGEDLDLVARMSLQGPFRICNKELVRRNETIDNLSKQAVNNGIYTRELFEGIYGNLKKIRTLTFQEKYILDRALSSNGRALGNLLLRSGKFAKARNCYKRALLTYPSIASLLKYLFSFLPAKAALCFDRKGRHISPGKDLFSTDKK